MARCRLPTRDMPVIDPSTGAASCSPSEVSNDDLTRHRSARLSEPVTRRERGPRAHVPPDVRSRSRGMARGVDPETSPDGQRCRRIGHRDRCWAGLELSSWSRRDGHNFRRRGLVQARTAFQRARSAQPLHRLLIWVAVAPCEKSMGKGQTCPAVGDLK